MITAFGKRLYEQSRGIDNRPVEPNRMRKSLSIERIFPTDIQGFQTCLPMMATMYSQLLHRIQESAADYRIKSQYIKIKFNDFKVTTATVAVDEINLEQYKALLQRIFATETKSIRLLGLGVHFHLSSDKHFFQQNLVYG